MITIMIVISGLASEEYVVHHTIKAKTTRQASELIRNRTIILIARQSDTNVVPEQMQKPKMIWIQTNFLTDQSVTSKPYLTRSIKLSTSGKLYTVFWNVHGVIS